MPAVFIVRAATPPSRCQTPVPERGGGGVAIEAGMCHPTPVFAGRESGAPGVSKVGREAD